ncbi:Uncharacterised protein [Serratia quinivorans]|uniref:hypothetical protein n=1 Tax=Serratia quinivorans TaxID=137545 RepID=UPI000D9C9BB0|nr:hypothetical protein [Serratia quinivorans]SPZ62970.1 Uncharacterised protein [Serratia quinivorans]VEI62901.1 Uncharacterised protein [Serratia quinivorans]
MKIYQRVFQAGTLVTILLLAGCQTGQNTENEPLSEQQSQAQSKAELEAARLLQCQKELEVLRTVQTKQFTDYKQDFDRLMHGAAQYSRLRTGVNTGTQDTVDALYRYRVNKLCAQIDQAVLLGLAERGESAQ